MRLYVVDDLEPARLIVRAIAEDVGYEVVGEAEDGAAAYTSIGDEEVRRTFLRTGAVAHVRKGDIAALVSALEAAKPGS